MFFFNQKTAYEMRISDWSSDVCSSDLYVAKPQQFSQWIHHYPLGLSPWRPNRRDQKPGRELGCETARCSVKASRWACSRPAFRSSRRSAHCSPHRRVADCKPGDDHPIKLGCECVCTPIHGDRTN